MRANLSASALWVILAATVASAQDASVDYGRDIKPILRERCYACHGALKQESGLRLDTAASLLKGGESGPAVVAAGRPDYIGGHACDPAGAAVRPPIPATRTRAEAESDGTGP